MTIPMTNDEARTNLEINDRPERSNAGRNVVIAMFVFAGALVTFMFSYWHYHTAKYRPLQDALAREFPRSKPRVEGGKHKLHDESLPRVLRVVMKVDFDADVSPVLAKEQLTQVRNLAEQHVDVGSFDELELHLYQTPPEQEIKQWKFTLPIRSPSEPGESADPPTAGKTPAPPAAAGATAER